MTQKYISYNLSKLSVLFFLVLIPSISVFSQTKRVKVNEDYIKKYKNIAINNMSQYKIPASITLAQGLMESGAGQSVFTKKSNNHFGIKCHKDWTGGKVYHDDDARNECFRKYKKPEDSFRDHAEFLSGKPRYSSLFKLKITDYKGWAKGLQKAGYATDKSYANKLIKLIEDYELHQYDKAKTTGKYDDRQSAQNNSKQPPTTDKEIFIPNPSSKPSSTGNKVIKNRHTPYRTHNLVYVIAKDGDTYEDIAYEFDFSAKDLYEYNEVPSNYPLKNGDYIYFQKKKNKADKPYYEHVVKTGESMHKISQLYGIKVKNLYKMNKKGYEYVPTKGDVLKLR